MSNTQETVTVYIDNVAFEVDYQFDDNYMPSNEHSGFELVGIAGTDEETGEREDFSSFLKVGKGTVFYELVRLTTLIDAYSDWQKATNEIKSANEYDNSRS